MVEAALKHLENSGESIEGLEADGWELVGKEPVENMNEEKWFSIKTTPTERSAEDSGLYKILYEYSTPNGVPEIIGTSRSFCKRIINYQNRTKRRFRKEDIVNMSLSSENKEFGSYDIYRFKGSYGCRHFWRRLIYFRKRNNQGRFLGPSTDPSKSLDEQNDKRVANVPYLPQVQPPDGSGASAQKVNPKPKR